MGPRVEIDDPHNVVLGHLMDAGVVGLAALLTIAATLYATALAALRRASDLATASWLAGIVGSVTAFLVQGQFDLGAIATDTVFWLILALSAGLARHVRETGFACVAYTSAPPAEA